MLSWAFVNIGSAGGAEMRKTMLILAALVLLSTSGGESWAASAGTAGTTGGKTQDCIGSVAEREAALARDYANWLDQVKKKLDEDCLDSLMAGMNALTPGLSFDWMALVGAACEAVDTTLDSYRSHLSQSLGGWNSLVTDWGNLDSTVAGRLNGILRDELAAAAAPPLQMPDLSQAGVSNALDTIGFCRNGY